ncbi:MAG: hypothetical protein QFX33_00385 [Candidatus Nezhaarchaeota archaeon]|nr:hypothetical protein [Candidatus Nezhaarchaeota archaeon]
MLAQIFAITPQWLIFVEDKSGRITVKIPAGRASTRRLRLVISLALIECFHGLEGNCSRKTGSKHALHVL